MAVFVPGHSRLIMQIHSFQWFQKVPIVPAPTCFLPRAAGEDQGQGLNHLNGLNVLKRFEPFDLDQSRNRYSPENFTCSASGNG
jgi:hypothetical protein